MAERPVDFDLYRMIVLDDASAFEFMGRPIKGDSDILAVLHRATDPDVDVTTEGGSVYQYKYSARDYIDYNNGQQGEVSKVVGFTFARTVVQQQGLIVTDDSIMIGTSTPDPPIGTATRIIFFMERHIAAIAYNGSMMESQAWRAALHSILENAAARIDFRSRLVLEPIPQKSEVLETFRSFSLLTRLKVHLKLPNPELSRYAKSLFDDMKNGGVRDLLQDMKNREGLNQAPGNLPFAAAAMADAGYKEGEVTMEGTRNGKYDRAVTGQVAARASVELEGLRDFVRGAGAIARTRESKALTDSILREIDRVVKRPEPADQPSRTST